MEKSQTEPANRVLTVAGVDRSADLGGAIADAAERLPRRAWMARRVADESAILTLGNVTRETEFLQRHLDIFCVRNHLGFGDLAFHPGRRWFGGIVNALRRLGWRVLRQPHDWLAFQQNALNTQLLTALRHEVRLRQKENADLRERIAALEASAGASQQESDS